MEQRRTWRERKTWRRIRWTQDSVHKWSTEKRHKKMFERIEWRWQRQRSWTSTIWAKIQRTMRQQKSLLPKVSASNICFCVRPWKYWICFRLSAECQKKINETKAAACECAKSELGGAAGTQLNDEMTKCGAGEQEHENKDHPTTFIERLIEKICSKKEDKCDKPFKGGNGNWKGGKGKEGKRFSSSKWMN